MNILSNKERLLQRFPGIARHFANEGLPSSMYHHGGMRSPYTTELDDLHDIAEIAAIVGHGKEHLLKIMIQNPDEPHRDYRKRLRGIADELKYLQEEVQWFANRFLSERIKELDEHRRMLFYAVEAAEKQQHEQERQENSQQNSAP